MSIVLESINVEPEQVEPVSNMVAEPVEEEPAEAVEEESAEPEPIAPPAAAPKKRGRPPKAKAEPVPKAPAVLKPKSKAPARKKPPPPEESDSSSDVEETLRNVYNHVAKPDMETAILQMLVNRRQSEQERRRNLWGQLARF